MVTSSVYSLPPESVTLILSVWLVAVSKSKDEPALTRISSPTISKLLSAIGFPPPSTI